MMKRRETTMKKLLSILLMVSLMLPFSMGFTISVSAATFSGGDGSAGNPYLITNEAQLNEISNNLSSYFKLMNNITVGTWTAIGTGASSAFKGTLDGNDKTITITGGIISSRSNSYQAGFFGYTNDATIKNLTLKSSNSSYSFVDGYSYVGSFVGQANGTLILTNCKSSMNVYGSASFIGGLVGSGNDVRISNCSYTGNVSGATHTGGIIGEALKQTTSSNPPSITKCYVSGSVTGKQGTGGIIGYLYGGNISQCYSTANVTIATNNINVGGIVGYATFGRGSECIIENCFSSGAVTGSGSVGGIIGASLISSGSPRNSIRYCYSTGKIDSTGSGHTGGIIGNNVAATDPTKIDKCVSINSQIKQSNSNKSTVGRVAGLDLTQGDNYAWNSIPIYYNSTTSITDLSAAKHGTDVTLANLKTEAFYKGIGWDFSSVWKIDPAVSPYPILRWDAPIEQPPVITASDRTVDQYEKVNLMEGVSAKDRFNTDITNGIAILVYNPNQVLKDVIVPGANADYTFTEAGIWQVMYNVADSRGNGTTKTFNITVKPKVKTNIRVNDDDSNVTYYGNWETISGISDLYQGDQHYSNESGAYVEFSFTGTEIKWITATNNNLGKVDIYLDGVLCEEDFDLYSSSVTWQKVRWHRSGLPYAQHTIKIVVTGGKNENSSDCHATIDAFEYVGYVSPEDVPLTKINDNNQDINYNGEWLVLDNCSDLYKGDQHYANEPGAYVEYSFTGTQISWIGATNYNLGKVDVYVDGVLEKAGLDLYSEDVEWQKELFQKTGMSYGSHTIKIVVTGQKNDDAEDCYLTMDAFEYR